MEHELKVNTEYYHRLANGTKTFEIRKNDRDYQVGDTLLLREYLPKEQTICDYSQVLHRKIVYMTSYAQQDNYVVLGLEDIDDKT